MTDILALPADHPVAKQNFVEVETPQYDQSPKGDPKLTTVFKAAQGEDFCLVAVLFTEQVGTEVIHNPLLYVIERKNRKRPSGWGHVQPYGKRTDKKTEKIIPNIDPKKVIGNISDRIEQMRNQPAVEEVIVDNTAPAGVFVYPGDGEDDFVLHIPAMHVTSAQAKDILHVLSKK